VLQNSSPPVLLGIRVVHEDPDATPTTYQGDLAKLPLALTPLIERPQWAVWRWTWQRKGHWQKPPFQALDPRRHASTKDPRTWSDYATALAAVQAGDADGISYVLTENDWTIAVIRIPGRSINGR
jgi:primase-polymerase (primpol)-like protein